MVDHLGWEFEMLQAYCADEGLIATIAISGERSSIEFRDPSTNFSYRFEFFRPICGHDLRRAQTATAIDYAIWREKNPYDPR